jgi:spore coat polysaccharide biosynthesis protein SpsF (cytidylyltransferase family)
MTIIVIVQARMGSKRFPGKVLEQINNKPVVKYISETLEKLKIDREIDNFIFAVPDTPENKPLWNFFENEKINFFKGSNEDVLDRFYKCAIQNNGDTIVRLCADNPFIEKWQITQQLQNFEKHKKFTYGNGAWVFSFEDLEESWKNGNHPEDREHVVSRMYKTIDYPDDLKRLQKINQILN